MLKKENDKVTINLSNYELWYLSKLFAPGLLFGVDDPTVSMSEEEIQAADDAAYRSLNQAGLIKMDGKEKLEVDEILGGMVYSCIHSKEMLSVSTSGSADVRFFHFLPQWQLEMYQLDDGYQLTLFKERSDLFTHVLKEHQVNFHGGQSGEKFTILENDLKEAAALYSSGEKERALEVVKTEPTQYFCLEELIQGYHAPQQHLILDMLYDRDDDHMMHSRRNELLQTNKFLFWLSYDQAGDEGVSVINVTSFTSEECHERFNLMLPLDVHV